MTSRVEKPQAQFVDVLCKQLIKKLPQKRKKIMLMIAMN